MLIENLNPKIDITLEFKLSNYKKIPTSFGCYVISNFNFEIMYVGKASSIQLRFLNHLDSQEKLSLTPLGKAYWFSFKNCQNEYEISKLERGWLNSYSLEHGAKPIFNKINASI
ncbi:hypothetical protein LS48_02025 [Aequorivita aquimaris]|uniref:GIY-YIG domain-containing protein n=1 Tax=Aequorivita aquimaris TaxID=1548749 RepID=A0A137RM74_9FLAO|nr:GIY-YIG nuclease family protein [Aequorivita aquimaris]KXO01265.1 hypothetical protein LS48_02025 [Aequorivita aquimaris]